jgi:hypothetical protein
MAGYAEIQPRLLPFPICKHGVVLIMLKFYFYALKY